MNITLDPNDAAFRRVLRALVAEEIARIMAGEDGETIKAEVTATLVRHYASKDMVAAHVGSVIQAKVKLKLEGEDEEPVAGA